MATWSRRGPAGQGGPGAEIAMAWRVRLVRQGDRYGPRVCLRHTGPEPFVELHPERLAGLRRCVRLEVDELRLASLVRHLPLDAREGWSLTPAQLFALLEWLGRPDAAAGFLSRDGVLHARREADQRRGLPRRRRHEDRFRRWDEPSDPRRLEEMVDLLVRAGPQAHGGDPEGEAVGWLEGRFTTQEAAAWIEQGVDDAVVAADLRDAGMLPHQAALRPSAGTLTAGGHRFSGTESVAEAVRLGRVSVEEVRALRRAAARSGGASVFPAGTWT